MWGFVVLPLTFLGGTYYQWTKLAPVQVAGIHWLQILVLINPLIYVTEGMRAGLTPFSHLHLYIIYPVLVGVLRRLPVAGAAELPPPRARLTRDPRSLAGDRRTGRDAAALVLVVVARANPRRTAAAPSPQPASRGGPGTRASPRRHAPPSRARRAGP